VLFDLPSSFLTGIEHLDGEHRELIGRINSVAELERSGETALLLGALANFMADLAEHFASEETHLKDMNYPKLSSHNKHHAETIVALERLIRDMKNGEPIERGVAHICFHELISAVLMTDMEFVSWLVESKGNAG
jgi:hemerythrin-like metal-binding protein